jgi:nitrate/TMAO reductase-like tetraheme cytochrome c subunit
MRRVFGVLALALALLALVAILRSPPQRAAAAGAFTSSEQCKSCHEQQYAEWSGSWHARSWSDPEVRALSNDFANADCIDCHAPQPVFETGIGQRVLPRSSRRGEGVDCIACHALPAGHGSGGLVAGTRNAPDAACSPIALRDLGSSAFCASCHDQHDTTKQWRATDYAARGIGCVECHMPQHGHALLGGHDIELVRKAVEFRGRAQGDHWLVEVENVGAGHHFPTEERARAADVFWRPLDGAAHPWTQVYRFRSPYHHEALPDTLLPAHETRAIPIADAPSSAAIEVALFYSLKPYWADPEHPDPEHEARLVARLELRP